MLSFCLWFCWRILNWVITFTAFNHFGNGNGLVCFPLKCFALHFDFQDFYLVGKP